MPVRAYSIISVPGGDRPPEERSLAELVSAVTELLPNLVRLEIELAKGEVLQKAKRLGLAVAVLAGAGVLALFGAIALLVSAILALAIVLPGWLAALLVAVALFLVAGLTGLTGALRLRRGLPPLPERALASVQEDVRVLKSTVKREQ